MDDVDLGSPERPRPILISKSLNKEEKASYIELLNEFRDVFEL